MSAEAWGLVLVAYVVPFWIWQFTDYQRRSGLVPAVRQAREDASFRWGAAWCVGLALILWLSATA